MIIEVAGGLTSRLDVLASIISTKYFPDHIKLVWKKVPGLMANFHELFTNNIEFIDVDKLEYSNYIYSPGSTINPEQHINSYLTASWPVFSLIQKRADPRGVRTRTGRLLELDVLVLATGFRVDRFLRPIEVTGRDGVKLSEVSRERPNAYLSISIPRFPNLFMLNGPNGPVGNFSLITIADMQLHYILQLVAEIRAGRAREVSASEAEMARFSAEFDAAAKNTIWATGCRSWYLDARGVPAVWPFTYQRFVDETAHDVLLYGDVFRGVHRNELVFVHDLVV